MAVQKRSKIVIIGVVVVVLIAAGLTTYLLISHNKDNKGSDASLAKPAAPNLSTPIDAVKSYLKWRAYAYAIQDASVAKSTMTAAELSRLETAIAQNTANNVYLEQKPGIFELIVGPPGSKTAAIVMTHETWTLSHISLADHKPVDTKKEEYHYLYRLKKEGQDWKVDVVVKFPIKPAATQ